MQADLFPVGGDYSDVFSREFRETLLSLCFKQLDEVVDQNLNLRHIEEGWTVGLPLISPHHPMKDHWETL